MLEKDIWVIVPAHNEEKTIREVITRIKKFTANIVVVVDGSTDNTLNIAQQLNVHTLHHIVNLGKGSALKTGCEYVLQKGAKKFVVLDADLQHDPEEIPNFVKNLDGNDIVFGYRVMTEKMPLIFRFGNWIINMVLKILYNICIKDSQCGYRAFTAEAYKKIRWTSSDYFMESEMVANVGKYKLKYKEIPIKTIYTDKYKGTTVLDGIKIVINLFWWRIAKKQL